MLARVLIACADGELRKRMSALAATDDRVVHTLRPGKRFWSRILKQGCDLALVERCSIPAPALTSIRALLSVPEAPEVIVLTEGLDPEDDAVLLAEGCRALVRRDVSDGALAKLTSSVLENRSRQVNRALEEDSRATRSHLSEFQSKSSRMLGFLEFARKVVNTDSTLLITGETGVGKEHLARAIHADSPRSPGPFIAVNCGALPETLLESELFGHEEGAFTGATRSRRGRFELAHRGTIFLDEIAELAPHLQVKLLHILQTKEVQRVGGTETLPVDVRIMAATNRDLAADIEAKRFRLDLYYRLSVITLEVPPLRERAEDIPQLVAGFIGAFQGRFVTLVRGISEQALAALGRYAWPGNIRELINIVERTMLLAEQPRIEIEDLPRSVRGLVPPPWAPPSLDPPGPESGVEAVMEPLPGLRKRAVAQLEKRYLMWALRRTRGRVGQAAALAGIQRRVLYGKMKAYGLSKEEFRGGSGAPP